MVQDQKNSARGKLVVVALLSISAIAGLGAIYYWSTWVVVVDPYGVGVKGNSSMTHQQIKDRFDRLSVGINEAMGGTSKLSDVVMSRVVAFVDDHPNHAGGYRLLGQALLENGRRKDAYRSWTRSLELNQEDEHRAELLINTGTLALELAGALDDQLMPKEILKDEVKRAKWLKEQSKERERLLKATELYYGEAIKLDNGSPRYYFFLGSLFMKQERFDQAEEMLDQALELDSTLFAAHYLMSQIYLKQDNYQRAIQSLNDAIDHVPDTKRDLQVLYLLDKSRVLRMDDRIEESLQVLTESLTPTEQDEPKAVDGFTHCYELLEMYESAAQLWERQMGRFRNDWKPAAEAAKWRLKAGQIDQAREHLRSLKLRSPLHPMIPKLEKQINRGVDEPHQPNK